MSNFDLIDFYFNTIQPYMMFYVIIACLAVTGLHDFIVGIRDSIKFHKKENARKRLLTNAAIYLEPYVNIWEHQTLANKNVKVMLYVHVIIIQKTTGFYKIHISHRRDVEGVWNSILALFSTKTTYESLIKDLQALGINESRLGINIEEKIKEPKIEKTDINNCSEMELTKLPGINIVMAKRIVKKRLEIRGFKSKKEFFEYIKLKEHFVLKLEKQITVKKIKIPKPIKLYKERKVDL